MSKEDAPTPVRIPKKRYQLEKVLDRWLAEWLARDDLTPSERRRVEEERAARRARNPDVRVALVVDGAGATPAQRDRLAAILPALNPTEIHHAGVASPVHQICKRTGAAVTAHDRNPVHVRDAVHQEIIRELADVVVALPKEASEVVRKDGGVWSAVKYAKHRNLPVRVIMPTGDEGN